jgi:sugar fermentation stimulation protein A
MLPFAEEVIFGRLIKRYKRFFMDVELKTKEIIIAFVPNTGSMMGLLEPGNLVMLTKSYDKKRTTAFTLQAIKVNDTLVGINTHLPNKLIKASLNHMLLGDLANYSNLKTEMPYGKNMRSRVDFYFYDSKYNEPPLYLEVKNVTMRKNDHAQFPDAISIRARKHVEDLIFARKQGHKTKLLFIVQRMDCRFFSPARNIDAHYARMLAMAYAAGVEIKALCAEINSLGLSVRNEIPCILEG